MVRYADRIRAAQTHSVAREGFTIEVDDETSSRMARVRQRGTKPELVVRQLVTELGLRYRLSNRSLPGSPDLANRARGWAIFVHGCFWHRHPGCRLTTTPKRNRAFWEAKFDRNVARDKRVRSELRRLGLEVMVVWECQTRDPARLHKRLAAWLSRHQLVPTSP